MACGNNFEEKQNLKNNKSYFCLGDKLRKLIISLFQTNNKLPI